MQNNYRRSSSSRNLFIHGLQLIGLSGKITPNFFGRTWESFQVAHVDGRTIISSKRPAFVMHNKDWLRIDELGNITHLHGPAHYPNEPIYQAASKTRLANGDPLFTNTVLFTDDEVALARDEFGIVLQENGQVDNYFDDYSLSGEKAALIYRESDDGKRFAKRLIVREKFRTDPTVIKFVEDVLAPFDRRPCRVLENEQRQALEPWLLKCPELYRKEVASGKAAMNLAAYEAEQRALIESVRRRTKFEVRGTAFFLQKGKVKRKTPMGEVEINDITSLIVDGTISEIAAQIRAH